MRVALIAAVADNGVIGRGGGLPWRLPADLKRFRRLTMGHHLIVGRKTWQSIGKPLEGRQMLAITRSETLEPPGAERCGSLEEALARAAAAGDDEPFIAGGAEIYRLALPLANRLYLTRVHATPAGNVHFPSFEAERWRLIERLERQPDERNPHRLSFETYERLPESAFAASAEPSSSRLR
ncbi:MAG: dihydrofolate reductase [Thermoanaerobaculia bacterium]